MIPQQSLCQLQASNTHLYSSKEWCACGTAVLDLKLWRLQLTRKFGLAFMKFACLPYLLDDLGLNTVLVNVLGFCHKQES